MKTLLIFLCLLLCETTWAKQTDTVQSEKDTLSAKAFELSPYHDVVQSDSASLSQSDSSYSHDDNSGIQYVALPDSMPVEKRSFNEEKIKTFKSDPEMNYREAPTVAESLWDRLLNWIAQFLDTLFDNAVNTNWGRVVVYAVGLVLLVVLIMMMLKVNAFKVLYSGGSNSQAYQILDENIHEMDFDKLIQEALDSQDYRKGVRLLFLFALKLLSDRHLIHWESGKTNHDYVRELDTNELRLGFNELSFYFDYAWYGNFKINQETFKKAQDTFTDWKGKLN